MRYAPILGGLLALSPLAAQGDFDLDKVTAGTLGGTLTLEVSNAGSNRLFGVMISYDDGPTAIAPFDPADPRSVAVGLDLVSNWYVLGTGATGSATWNTSLPNIAAFHGDVLHWQCATLPGTATILDGISNPVRTHLGLAGQSALLPAALQAPRAAAVVCEVGDGDLLLVGAAGNDRFRFRSLDSVAGPAMVTPRGLPAAARLNDGRYLFAGGVDGTGAAIAACEIYDPATDTFTAVANMRTIRAGHAAATMANGRVLVVGGTNNFTDLLTAAASTLNTAEIYDPNTNTWTAAPNIGGRRLVPALSTLSNGKTMISGGIEVTVFFGIPIAVSSTTAVQLFDPTTNSWSNGPAMPAGRAYHHDSQVTLADGRVLMSGGVLVPSLAGAANATSIRNADIYDPVANSWTATMMAADRTTHTATRLANGTVIVCGGAGGLLSAATPLDSVEAFDPTTNTWSAMAALTGPRAAHMAALMPDGLLVLLGGDGSTDGEALHF
ncbi:MAG: hypothetical protein KDC98_23415 [Planctomycetes bacterium]|nr:hypothetical protein [Planctomycetota bacterium]